MLQTDTKTARFTCNNCIIPRIRLTFVHKAKPPMATKWLQTKVNTRNVAKNSPHIALHRTFSIFTIRKQINYDLCNEEKTQPFSELLHKE